ATAQSNSNVDALAFVGSLAGAIGDIGVGIAGGAAISVNAIGNTVHGEVTGSQIELDSGALTVHASDTSGIKADSAGAGVALAGSFELAAAGIALGIGASVNNIQNDVSAAIDDSTVTTHAGVSVEATSAEGISVFSFGLAGSVGVGSVGGGALVGGSVGPGGRVANSRRDRAAVGRVCQGGNDRRGARARRCDEAILCAHASYAPE